MDNQQACVWATRKELWDSFLNDPELARALDSARSSEPDTEDNTHTLREENSAYSSTNEGNTGQRIGARLRAYETPITDEILRQSIR
ncbi:MAG: hypothetical protein AB8B97_10755 [Granulosicoccus sp.]